MASQEAGSFCGRFEPENEGAAPMSGFPEYDRFDAVGLAELVRKKEVKAQELSL